MCQHRIYDYSTFFSAITQKSTDYFLKVIYANYNKLRKSENLWL